MFKNSYFDVNVLEDAYVSPNIDLAIPLSFNSTIFKSEDNVPDIKDWKLLLNFIEFTTGIKVNDIYTNNEYHYKINKYSPQFHKKMERFMNERLQNDEILDSLVYDLINKELNLNLIKSKDLGGRFKEVREFMVKYYKIQNKKNFPTFSSSNFLRVCYVTVIKILQKMFPDGIYCNRQQFADLHTEYLKDPMSIVYLPCHKSHVDYIILHIFAVRFQLATPTVIAGENLNVAIFGTILKKLGAIFIKRSFNNELYTETNLNNLLEFVMENNIDMELFIEGTRSRDGKLLLPKYGILKMFQNVLEKTGKDVLIQPLSITYERIYEADGYLKELIGSDKKQESFVSIIGNGINNLTKSEEKRDIDRIIEQNKPYNNLPEKLNGKIFVKLGDRFKLSEHQGNLKQVAFKTLHTINSINYLPEISIVGTVIQLYLYRHPNLESLRIMDLKPLWDLVLDLFEYEISNDINKALILHLKSLDNNSFMYLIKYEVIKFFKYIVVSNDELVIKNTLELLYYKNSTIHLLINKSIMSLIILSTDKKHWTRSYEVIKYLLKNEFLFDYNENEKDSYTSIINKFVEDGRLSKDLNVLDTSFFEDLSAVVKPFIKSYMICIRNIEKIMTQYYSTNKEVSHEHLMNNNRSDFPNTRNLLKLIQRSEPKADFESINKQYLLSEIYYLNHLGLISIFKNYAKTLAYVKIENAKDLNHLYKYLSSFFEPNDVDIHYAIDLIEKTTHRQIKL